MTVVRYKASPPGDEFRVLVEAFVQAHGCRTICDIGGGANPVLSEEFIARHGLCYFLVDESEEELARAPSAYEKIVANAEAVDGLRTPPSCDLAISQYLLEHISAPERFHRNVHALLRPGGRAAHYFSTLYALPFTVNRLLPHALSEPLASFTLPERDVEGNEGVFPARYRWCRGPLPSQLRRLHGVGYEVEEYIGYFGHTYFRRLPALQELEYKWARLLLRHPVPALTSFAYMRLAKPC